MLILWNLFSCMKYVLKIAENPNIQSGYFTKGLRSFHKSAEKKKIKQKPSLFTKRFEMKKDKLSKTKQSKLLSAVVIKNGLKNFIVNSFWFEGKELVHTQLQCDCYVFFFLGVNFRKKNLSCTMSKTFLYCAYWRKGYILTEVHRHTDSGTST